MRSFAELIHDEARLAERVRQTPPILVGTAWERLRGYFPTFALEEVPLDAGWQVRYATRGCLVDFAPETLWELHIDPYDNLQTNCGVILGKATAISPRECLQAGPQNANDIAKLLATDGPFGLVERARREHGYTPPQRVPSKCALCYEVRTFLRPWYPEILGPDEIYPARPL